jgi:hypothetical protein
MAAKRKKRAAIAMPRVDKKWQAQQDLRTLQEAKDIQASRSRIAAAKREAMSQVKALNSVVRKGK